MRMHILTMTVSVTVTKRPSVATQRLTYTGLSQNQVGGHKFNAGQAIDINGKLEGLHGGGNSLLMFAFKQQLLSCGPRQVNHLLLYKHDNTSHVYQVLFGSKRSTHLMVHHIYRLEHLYNKNNSKNIKRSTVLLIIATDTHLILLLLNRIK